MGRADTDSIQALGFASLSWRSTLRLAPDAGALNSFDLAGLVAACNQAQGLKANPDPAVPATNP